VSTPPRVLYLAHRVPYPPDKGDRIRNFHVLRELAKRARVWLACLADEPVGEATRTKLNDLCERVEIVPVGGKSRWFRAAWSASTGRSLTEGAFHEPGLGRTLERWKRESAFAAALVSASSLAPYLERELNDLPGFVDLVDVDSQKWFDFAASKPWPKSWLYAFEGRRVRKLEIRLGRWAKAVTIVSRAECAVYDRFAAPAKGTVATNGVDLEYFKPEHPTPHPPPRSGEGEPKQALTFVGAMDYYPNVDAAVWFAHEIWLSILARHPRAEFRIVGRRPAAEVVRLAGLPGVKLHADVPDVRPYLAEATLAVCPIRIARGLQNKVVEAMAMGKATVAAPAAIAALGVRIGEDLLSATTPGEWVDTVGALLNDDGRRNRLGIAARRYVEAHHHWDRCLQPLFDAMAPYLRSRESAP
jgi:sugar transferase (PEP-CTERM/EpsH1 system associated)